MTDPRMRRFLAAGFWILLACAAGEGVTDGLTWIAVYCALSCGMYGGLWLANKDLERSKGRDKRW